MAGASSTIIYDDLPVRSAVEGLTQFEGERAHAMFDSIGDAMVQKSKLRFREQHGPDGAAWIPSKRALKTGTKTLILHGYLLASLTHNVLDGNEGVEWGSPLVYASVHQDGATIHIYARSQQIYRRTSRGELKPGFVKKSKSNFASWHVMPEHDIRIPARPYLGIDEDDRVEITDIEIAHMDAAMKGVSVAAVRGAA